MEKKKEIKFYAVSLCLCIEAETKEGALREFNKIVKAGDYTRDSIDIELDFTQEE